VLIEAMATGLPVIATDYPGVRVVVDEGETGLVVPAGDPEAVAGAMRELLGRAAEGRRRMGDAGRQTAVREWGWEALLDRMDVAYSEAIEARRAKLGGAA
jgi:glycosyltransferase involved in cell wall biosynthesis